MSPVISQECADAARGFRVLVAIDERPDESVTLKRAMRWHRALPGHLDVLRVVSEVPLPHSTEARIRDELRDMVSSVSGSSAVSYHVVGGKVSEVIRERVIATDCDLLILGRYTKPSLMDRWFGGVAESLLARPPCPILLPGRSTESGLETGPDRVLLLSDASVASRAAFPLAARVVKAFGASLTVVQVCPPESLPGEREYQRHGPAIESLRRGREADFARWLEDCPEPLPLKRQIRLLEGYPYEAVCRHATTAHADLIMLSSRGCSGLRGLTGGTAMRIARDAPCPVLLVPSPPPKR